MVRASPCRLQCYRHTPDGRALREEFEQAIAKKGYEFSTSDDNHIYLGIAIHRVAPTYR